MSSTIVHFSLRTTMEDGKTILKVKDKESSAYPGLGQDAPHKSPGGSPNWYKKVLLISWLDYSQYLVFFPQALKSTIIDPSSTGYRRKMSHNHQKPNQGLLSRMRLLFCLRWMVAPQWGVQWVPDIPTNPLTSVVHLKQGSTSSSKVTEESNLAPYIHEGYTKTATWETKQHIL